MNLSSDPDSRRRPAVPANQHRKNIRGRSRLAVALMAAVVAATSAALGNDMTNPQEQANRALDRAVSYLKEYGTATMSGPLLSPPDKNFEFGLQQSADSLYTNARTEVQGAAGTSEQVLQSLAFGASLSLDPTQAAAYQDQLANYRRQQTASAEIDQAKLDLAKAKRDQAIQAAQKETDLDKRAAAVTKAQSDYLADLSANTTGSAQFPTADSSNLPTVSDPSLQNIQDYNKDVLGGRSFARGPGALLPSTQFVLPPRDAMITAAGDRAVQAILTLFGKPEEAARFTGRSIYFGAAVVSVLPGWRTRLGYSAQLVVHIETAYRDAEPNEIKWLANNPNIDPNLRALLYAKTGEELPNALVKKLDFETSVAPAARNDEIWHRFDLQETEPDSAVTLRSEGWLKDTLRAQHVDVENETPERLLKLFHQNPSRDAVVTPISPLTEGQSLDTQSSVRHRTELALSLALALHAAGKGEEAKAVEQYVRQNEADVGTRGTDIAVAAYSAGGGLFGYQIGPSLHGLSDPSDPKSKSGYVLQRRSFPVLLLFGLNRWQQQPLVIVSKATKKIFVQVPTIKMVQTCRWEPLKGPSWFRTIFPRKAEKESARLEIAQGLVAAENYFDNNPSETDTVGLYRTRELIHLLNGVKLSLDFPPQRHYRQPQVAHYLPAAIELEADDTGAPEPKHVTIVLAGRNFSEAVARSVTSLRPAQTTPKLPAPKVGVDTLQVTYDPNARGALIVEADVQDADSSLTLVAQPPDAPAGEKVFLASIPVSLQKKEKPTQPVLSYEESKDPKTQAVSRRFTLTGTVPDEVLKAAQSLVDGQKPATAATDQKAAAAPSDPSKKP